MTTSELPREAMDPAALAVSLAERIGGLSPESVARPTLVYLDIIGICWPLRALFHLKDFDYDLVQVPIMAWIQRTEDGQPLLPSLTKNAHLPIYVDKDVMLNQSTVLFPYMAEKLGVFGDSQADRFAIQEVMTHCYDALFHWGGMLQVVAKMNVPEDVFQARLDAFMGRGAWGLLDNYYHKNLQGFENYLTGNPADSGYMAGSRLSFADLQAFNVLCNWYKAFDREAFGAHPLLEDYIQRLASDPRILDYIRNHQEATTWLPFPPLGHKLTEPSALEGLIG